MARRNERILIKGKGAYEAMYMAGQLLACLFEELQKIIQPSVTTGYIDARVEEYLTKNGLVSQTKGYCGYRHVSCISINSEVVHGVPSMQRVVQDGDLVKVDVCAAWRGYCADMARCFFAGRPQKEAVQLVEIAQCALDAGIRCAVPEGRLGTVSAAIQHEVESAGYGVVRDFAGHGIGASMHEEPELLNYGTARTGIVIKPGMAFAIEPMITAGDYKVVVDRDDRWTVRTADQSLAAHVEDTVFVTEQGPVIITRIG